MTVRTIICGDWRTFADLINNKRALSPAIARDNLARYQVMLNSDEGIARGSGMAIEIIVTGTCINFGGFLYMFFG